MTWFIIQIAAFAVVIASIAFNFDVLKLEFGSFLACGLAIWLSLVTLQAFKHPEWLVYKQQKDYVTISSLSLSCRQLLSLTNGDVISVVYEKCIFWRIFQSTITTLLANKNNRIYFRSKSFKESFRFLLGTLDCVNKSKLMGVGQFNYRGKLHVLM